MGILDAYQDSTDRSLDVLSASPLDPIKPEPKHSGWTTIPRAVAAGAVEIGGNIIDVVHNRLALDVPAKGAEFDIMVETRDSTHADEIGEALKERGYELRMG